MNVQAFLNNISFPKTLEELEYFADKFNVEEILQKRRRSGQRQNGLCRVILFSFFTQKQQLQR